VQLRMRKDEMVRLEALAKEEAGRRLTAAHPATVTPPEPYDRTTWSGTAHLALEIGLTELERRAERGRATPSRRPPFFLVPLVRGDDLFDPGSARGMVHVSRAAGDDPKLGHTLYTSPFDGGMLEFTPLSLFYMGPKPGPRLLRLERPSYGSMLPPGFGHGIPLENFDKIVLPDGDGQRTDVFRFADSGPVLYPDRVEATIGHVPVGVTTFRLWIVATTTDGWSPPGR
jgi:hypothetical protein